MKEILKRRKTLFKNLQPGKTYKAIAIYEDRCTKCNNYFQRHHWKVSRANKQYHVGCFKKLKDK